MNKAKDLELFESNIEKLAFSHYKGYMESLLPGKEKELETLKKKYKILKNKKEEAAGINKKIKSMTSSIKVTKKAIEYLEKKLKSEVE